MKIRIEIALNESSYEIVGETLFRMIEERQDEIDAKEMQEDLVNLDKNS